MWTAICFSISPISTPRAERVTLYSSDGDRAVHLASKLHDAPRTGYFTPYTVIARKAIAL